MRLRFKVGVAIALTVILSTFAGHFFSVGTVSGYLSVPTWWRFILTGCLLLTIGITSIWIILERTLFLPLSTLHETIKRQEREVFFGKLAAGLVHDLRHPIQNLQHCGKNLKFAATDPKLALTLEKNFNREFEKLAHFLRDLEDLSGTIPHVPTNLDLSSTIADVVDSFQQKASHAHINIDVKVERTSLIADRFAIIRLLSNLIDNAIDAMPQGGKIFIYDTQTTTNWELSVEDTGAGIDQNRLNKIFDPFWTTKARGLGLGLAICKKIAEQQGGILHVRSQPGKGTCFTLTIPST